MEAPFVTHNTFVIERSYPTPPEKVFAAFADPAKKRRWFFEARGVEGGSFKMDFRVGGIERTASVIPQGPYKGAEFVNDTIYQDIVTNRRVVFAYAMTVAGRRISASLSTVELLQTTAGTNLIYTEQAAFFEGADGAEMRKGGWSKIFEGLEKELAS